MFSFNLWKLHFNLSKPLVKLIIAFVIKKQQHVRRIASFSLPHYHYDHTWNYLQTKPTTGLINPDYITQHSSNWIPCLIVRITYCYIHDPITLFHRPDGSIVMTNFECTEKWSHGVFICTSCLVKTTTHSSNDF